MDRGMTAAMRLILFGGEAAELPPFVPPPPAAEFFLAAEDGTPLLAEDGEQLIV